MGETPPSEFLSTAELLISEVVSNAIQAGSACSINVWFANSEGNGVLRVEVADTAEEFPTLPRRPTTAASVRRRGLGLVDHLSTRWGVTIESDHKQVWFELSG